MLLKSSECSPEVINFLANKACQCYVALCDWASVKEWQATVHGLKQNSTNPVSINLRTDFNYIQALSCFEEGDLTECGTQLELLPGEDYSLLSSSKDKLGECVIGQSRTSLKKYFFLMFYKSFISIKTLKCHCV